MKKQEGKMSTETMLFVCAILILIGAVYVYITKENNSFEKLASGVEAQNGVTERIEKQYGEMKKMLDAIREGQVVEAEFRDKTNNRMQLLEMRIDAMKTAAPPIHIPKPAVIPPPLPLPQPLRVELTTPIKVIYKQYKPAKKIDVK